MLNKYLLTDWLDEYPPTSIEYFAHINNPEVGGFLLGQSILNCILIFHFNGPRGGRVRITCSLGRLVFTCPAYSSSNETRGKHKRCFPRTTYQNNGGSSNIISIDIAGSWNELTFTEHRLHARLNAGSISINSSRLCLFKQMVCARNYTKLYMISQWLPTTILWFYQQYC